MLNSFFLFNTLKFIKKTLIGAYFDGRNPGMSEPLLTNRLPQGDHYLNWSFIPMGDGFYAIQSRSGGGYLDGRNPGMSELLITYRDPQNDHYLHWQLVSMGDGFYAIKSRSGNGYLDGRNPGMSEPLITYRDPENDNYLHWSFIEMDVSPIQPNRFYAIKSRSGGRFLPKNFNFIFYINTLKFI